MKTFYNLKSRTFYVLTIALFSTISAISQTTYNIPNLDDIDELEDLFETLEAGDTVILADGVYDDDDRIKFSPTAGTAAMPITFRAETPGGVRFTGGMQLSIGGDHVVVDGFYWDGGFGSSVVIEFRDGENYANYSTLQNCAMDGLAVESPSAGTSTKHNWVMLYGTYNTVINCSFMNKESSGNMILVELAYNAYPPVEDDEPEINTSCDIVGHTISNNYFYKYEKIDASLSNSGDSETIRIGTSSYQNVDSSVMVSNNYFVEADGENEIITNKSKNNSYINNTFRRSRGSLVLRHGSNATVEGNYFLGENVDGTGGIRIVDSEHTITNNYIQDCITVVDQSIWNNGITFLGGSSNNSVPCTSDNTSSDYQKVVDINVSNNTIINTNAPLFYNTDKGSTDPTGIVSNNLIYYTDGNSNITEILTGDTASSYADLGTTLEYSGNVYSGAALGETNLGFSEETGIVATPNGEIFTFSGLGSENKGADMGIYEPTTDAMVGYGIGACFLNNLGESIMDGDCTIEIPESLTISGLSALDPGAGSYDVSVNANVSWLAVSNDAWISLDVSSGTGDAVVEISVTENSDTNSRSGSVTFTQDDVTDGIVRILNITQDGADLTDLYDLINTGVEGEDPVTIHSFSQQEVDLDADPPKTNYAYNTLDKDTGTQWTASDGSILAGDFKGDGEYVIFDLDGEYELDLIQIATDDKADPYGIQFWVSTTGTDPSDFTMVLPTTADDLLITTTTGTRDDFDQYEVSVNARYVKLMSYGRFNTAGDDRVSAWSNITEVEFFGSQVLSVSEAEIQKNVSLYPNPVKNNLNIKVLNNIQMDDAKLYSLDGKLIMNMKLESSNSEFSIDLTELSSGSYILNLSALDGTNFSKLIIKE
ncbi:chondroitinase-B domain-containing protein [Winogradskyella psychrotolerans]|uniref:chondroitinase-B domain-containing protein n=1 Tax=Winogradskyella psychrotolerans TaxID=1344585 RepID=UPI001C06A5A9|nr:chondroitinase-B domain-containing protein [Winogradskyella psychrotolerans]MBU2929671.1 T9SS type A sorting domain-containing protein [Winogradskyella psychrotolerans]